MAEANRLAAALSYEQDRPAFGNPSMMEQGRKMRERKQAEQVNRSAQNVKSDLLARALMYRYNPETLTGLTDTPGPQTLDEAAGLDPRVDRSTFLPYSKKEGLHVPAVAADLMKLATASNPQYSNLMQPEEAMPLATNMMGGGVVASRLAPAPAGSLGMNVTSKRAFTAPHIDTKGLPNKGQELIRSKADELAEILNKQGFQATAEYSGSAVGPSAYVRVFDPQTGRFINDPARISGHSKGAFNSQFVHEISDDPQSMQKFVDLAMEMRAKGPTELMQKQTSAEQTAMQMRYESAQKKLAKGKSLTNSEQEAVNILGRMTSNSAPQDEALRLAQQRAALPVEQHGLGLPADNTPAQRAAAMGFTQDAYHGTTMDFNKFAGRLPTYAAEEPRIADIYANATTRHMSLNRPINAGPNIMPLKLGGKELTISDLGEGGGGWLSDNLAKALGIPRTRTLINELPNYGIDRLKVTDMGDLGGVQTQHMIPLGSDNIRSRFAAFDPFRRNAALAAALGVAAPDLLAEEKK